MKLRVFASGSKGNSLMVESPGGVRVLVDLGISCGALKKRMAAGGFTGEIDAVLFTHEHSDHAKGAEQFHKQHPAVPFYANGLTAEAVARMARLPDDLFHEFGTGEPFTLGDLTVHPIAISHDTVEPVAFYIEDENGSSLFVGTDTGRVTDGFRTYFANATCAILEANYDEEMLWTSNRSEYLKERIASSVGHLSNEDAAALVRANAGENLRILLAAHRSQQCNEAAIVEKTLLRALDAAGCRDTQFATLEQDFPSPVWQF
ncbi:MAG: MBL fold metallo-hydrolase [Kiritimatiellae bacterium]|nr:MBL fold metallo-hydrolase [Kiritimatiellia bacterium]